MLLLWLQTAFAATLPGVALPFVEAPEGGWLLGEPIPAAWAEAGVTPGWRLAAVDDLEFADPTTVQRVVAAGPARELRLRFALPDAGADAPETIVVLRRAPLVQVESVRTLPWPDGFGGEARRWGLDPDGNPVVTDSRGGSWTFDPVGAGFTATPSAGTEAGVLPEVFWHLSDATWVVDRGAIRTGSAASVRQDLQPVAHTRTFAGHAGDHLVLSGPDGVEVLSVTFPAGTPAMPTCAARVPETCFASGARLLTDLGDRPGAREEGRRQLGVACTGGVHRACTEALALDEPDLATPVRECVDGDVGACNRAAAARRTREPDEPSDLLVGLLEFGCELEGVGTLGERLRRIEDTGLGCATLAEVYDERRFADLALLSLDRACVLGRQSSCDEASQRRQAAFAARTVRECEDPTLPVALSCVELGSLLKQGPVASTALDEFQAFLRGCSLGAAEGCAALGDYVDRWGILDPRVAGAEAELGRACAADEQRACLGAAHLLVRHDPRSEAYGQALTLFDGACASGIGAACVAGAQQRRIGAARKVEAPDQIGMWTAGCDRLDPTACAGLGERLSRSKSELPAAFDAWGRACELGQPHACSELGRLVDRKHEPAFPGEQPPATYLAQGCDLGDPQGCYWLAERELPRSGEPPEATYLLLERSCEGEYGDGCAALAGVHLDRGTSFDEEIAARHLQVACDNGEYDSCRLLGTMYLRGRGVDRDRQRANELLERFRLNAERRYVRLGVQAGLPSAAGGELELVLPIPVGPALSVSGSGSFLPGGGTILVLIEGDSKPNVAPDYQYLGVSGRLYPNHQARGLYGAVGVHRIAAVGGNLRQDRIRTGWSARVGLRNDNKGFYNGLEMGLGQYGVVLLSDFDEEETGSIPLLLPTLAFSFGAAPF